ncbi:TPA: hypothetical protein UMY98_000305 [Stenotrophomonas maltophilia]|nr:hypothetical protein [Stenotrophomonas maltophilia]
MALSVLFEGTVAKHVESPSDNEDAYRLAPGEGRIVLADGASESFDARNWAHLLVDRMADEELSVSAVAACAQCYEALHDPERLTWSKAAAYQRGSFATLLVVQDLPESRSVRISAVGDSLAVWLDGDKMLASVPYGSSEQFLDKPSLLSTRMDLNEPEGLHCSVHEWEYEEQGHRFLLCMTDALGAWLLSHQERGDASALESLCGIRELHELVELVENERAVGRMRRDDSTLIIASVTKC